MKRLTVIFLLLRLISGTLLVFLSKHWFPIWLGLELRTLSVIPLLKVNIKSRRKEATIKYFLVQAFRAAILLKGATLKLWFSKSWKIKEMAKAPICYLIIFVAVIIKLGLAPCHFWFPDVLSGISFSRGIIIACWQKIAPLFILLLLSKKIPNPLIISCAALSVLIGGWGGLKQIRIRKILAYSSISHLGWISATLFFIPEAAFVIFLFYIIKKTMIFLICHKKNLFFISKLKKKNIIPSITILFSISLLSIGGLPPLGGFLKKLIPIIIFLKKNIIIIIPIFILGSLIRLYFYLRVVFKARLTLFPQHRIKILPYNKKRKNFIKITIRVLSPLTIWGILLTPLIFSFI